MQAAFRSSEFRTALASETPPTEIDRLAHALVAATLLHDPDAALEDYGPSHQVIRQKLVDWARTEPFRPLASFGAFLVTGYALDLVPSGLATFRHQAWGREGLAKALTEGGLSPDRVQALLGTWEAPTESGGPSDLPLDPLTLAGLAERSLTPAEHEAALNQVAKSPRDLARWVTAARWVDRVREGLAWLPQSIEPPRAVLAMGLWDRERRQRFGSAFTIGLLGALWAAEEALLRGESISMESPPAEPCDAGQEGAEGAEDTDDLQVTVAADDAEAAEPAVQTAELLGLRARAQSLGFSPSTPQDLAVRLEQVEAALCGRLPKARDSWSRRLSVIALMVEGDTEEAQVRTRPADPEHLWVQSRRISGHGPSESECRHRAADLVTELLGGALLTL